MTDRMRALIGEWNGHAVIARRDAETGTWLFIAVHDSTLGMAVGGCRMKVYDSPEDGLRDAMRLAEGMTYKWAAIDFPFGGGKSVLAVPGRMEGPAREGLLLRFGRLIDSLNGLYATGVDLGTSPADMRVMSTVCRFVMGVSGGGESADPGPYTALGVLVGIKVAAARVFGTEGLAGRRVLVQGVGDVGEPLARMLAAEGAELVLADIDAGRARALADELGAAVVPAPDVYGAECDIYAPCAVGATLNPETIPRLRCRIVAGSANNQLESEADAARLHERGILYAPDYIVNAGGAIAFGLIHRGVTGDAELRRSVGGIADSLRDIFEDAARSGESPALAARRRAERVLERARAAPG